MTERLEPTELGRVVARSGLLPETAYFFISYFIERRDALIMLLPDAVKIEDWSEEFAGRANLDQSERALSFVLSHLCFASPEYEETLTPPQRSLPYMITGVRRDSELALTYSDQLIYPWDRNVGAVNAAEIALDYSDGDSLASLEDRFENLTSGVINGLLRDHVAHLKGLADIIDVLTSRQLGDDHPYVMALILDHSHRVSLRRVLRHIRVRIMQMVAGVPEDVLWMRELKNPNGNRILSRTAIKSLRDNGLITLEDILDGGKQDKFHQAMNAIGTDNIQREEIKDAAIAHRTERTNMWEQKIQKQLPECEDLTNQLFASLGHEFETYVEKCFDCLNFTIVGRDDENAPPRYPDFFIEIANLPVVLECKSKENNDSVPLGAATEVGGKALAHGLNRNPMVTICQPYVSTDVARNIKTADDLSVVNCEDFAFAMSALKQGKISIEKFYSWITTPGQPRIDDLFH